MTPYLVTPPATLPVTVQAMRAHLRVAHDDDDADIAAKIAGAVGALDGWGGLLGRAIMPQTWAVDVTGPGPHVLPFPDVSVVTVQDETPTTRLDALGTVVTVPDVAPDQAITIQFTCGLPAGRLATAETLVKLMVAQQFDQLAGAEFTASQACIDAHIRVLRWRWV